QSLVSALGTRVLRTFNTNGQHPYYLGVRGSWLHELRDTNNAITASFAEATNSPAFTVQGTPRSRNAAGLGLEGRLDLGRNTQAFADYSATLSSQQQSHGIFGGLSVKW